MENQEKNYNDEEVDLKDYINVIIKRKRGILAIFFIIVIAVAIISLILPQTFEAVTLVKLGQIKNQSVFITLENIDDIKAIFSRENTLKDIALKLGLPTNTPLAKITKIFSIEPVEKTSLLKIKGRGATPQKALETTNLITDFIINRHQNLFLEAEKTINLEIETIIASQEKIKKNIEQIKTEINRLDNDAKFYTKEISQRDEAQSEGQGQVVQAYINLLAGVKDARDAKEQQISDLEQQSANLNQNLQQKEYEKTYQVKPTAIEVAAATPNKRIAPKRTQNVAIAAILGLFIGILWAFMVEYYEKNFKKNKQAY
ncbi:MAG: Wzz/FepE/Etk N-terminal domain-containing protein [Patescibacteria group bacterium]|nr:Wzz/FepE/Etk N-terminal domain-containing protein [Patescibacteria group bacterium]